MAVRCYLAVEQSDEGLARGSRLNGARNDDFVRADGFIVKALVRAIVRFECGTAQ